MINLKKFMALILILHSCSTVIQAGKPEKKVFDNVFIGTRQITTITKNQGDKSTSYTAYFKDGSQLGTMFFPNGQPLTGCSYDGYFLDSRLGFTTSTDCVGYFDLLKGHFEGTSGH